MVSHLPVLGVGLGFREPFRGELFLNQRQVDFLEITADHYLDAPAEKERELELLAAHFPLIPHGLSLSLGSAEGIDAAYLDRLAALVRRLDPPWWSEHIAFTRVGGVEIGHLSPLPFTREAVEVLCRNIAAVRRRTYGHDTGDQVLRLVASNLARVTGGGRAYRCGGEEFNILFPGKSTPDVMEHLERLRQNIEASEFRMRGNDRRLAPRGPDRRSDRTRRRATKGQVIRDLSQPALPASISVTVSIGVASSARRLSDPDAVLKAADKALYRAKANGRNRVETATPPRKAGAKAAGIA